MWRSVCRRFLPIRCTAMCKQWVPILLVGGMLALGLPGCGEQTQAPPASATATTHYEVRGSVISVDAAAKKAVIDHEKIVDLMDAMRMNFSVPDPADLEKLQPGKLIKATLVVENNAMWLESVTVLGDAPASGEPAETHAH